MKSDMSNMSVSQKYEYLQKKYLELWEIPDLGNTYTVGKFIATNFRDELEEIKTYKEKEKVK
jgi:hypothetical protein